MSALAQQAGEEPFFFGLGADRLFGFLHRPAGPVRGMLALCHAFAEEKLWSHRVYVTFARDAARNGFGVLRFDARGEGDSSREFEDTTIETRIDDTLRAAQVLRERIGGTAPLMLLGHRLGGSIAAVAATRAAGEVKGVIVWDPVPDTADYFGQLLRSNMATQMATEGKVTRARDALIQQILAGESVVVDGYGLTAALYREMLALSWNELPQVLPGPALIIEVPKGEQTTPSAVLAALAAARPLVQVKLAAEPPFWRETRQFHQRAPAFTQATLAWLTEVAAA